MTSQRLKLTLAFDGRSFSGWQSQADQNGVQDYLNAALARVSGSPKACSKVHGAGRTDAGVHALGQVAHVDVAKGRFAPIGWRTALNAVLPPEIRVLLVQPVPQTFHAQHCARGKIYRYRIWTGPVLLPLEVGRAWHVPQALDVELLARCTALVAGSHDFCAFGANRGKPEKITVRSIERATVRRRGPLLILEFRGDGFLYRMVRLLTGSMVQVGRRRAEFEWFRKLLEKPEKQKASFLAPADGLYLVRVFY